MTLDHLCNYYLRCLGLANQDGVVIGQNAQTDYVELTSHPFCDLGNANLLSLPGVSSLVNRARRDHPKKELVIGYPLCRLQERDGGRWRDVLKPVFVSEIRGTSSDASSILHADGSLMLNPGVIASFDNTNDVMAATLALAEEIGLQQEEPPGIEELCRRLHEARPSWPWLEDLAPQNLSQTSPVAALNQNGIVNRALILAIEPSNFTKGLETELSLIEKLSETALIGTALDAWWNNDFSSFQSPPEAGTSLLEPLPLNSEQREAVERALSQPLTVITGPPGTGKSQVVSTLLINAAVRGMRVIFSSRNNKAVDVVEQRVNSLGSLPILLRMGSDDHLKNLELHLSGLLSNKVTAHDREEFAEAQTDYRLLEERDRQLLERADHLIELRNQVDHAERNIEGIRAELGNALFQLLRREDPDDMQRAATAITAAARYADRAKQSCFVRWFWCFFRNQRLAQLSESSQATRDLLNRVGVTSSAPDDEPSLVDTWSKVGANLATRAEQARLIVAYSQLLLQLSQGERLDDLLAELNANQREKAVVSERVWGGWLRVMRDRLTAEGQTTLGNFSAVLRTILKIQADGGQVPAGTWSSYYRLLPEVSSFLPCWAVTALRVYKRFPFTAKDFDLLVIDEASQCDIPAVLPLLFRAKAAVIIGDPNQLAHISHLPAALDAQLLNDHGLSNRASWGYSVNSVFALASSLVQAENIVELKDHHRSHADIIGFSDKLFYGRKLRVATDYRKLMMIDPEKRAIQWIDKPGQVSRSQSDGTFNQAEASKVVEVLERLAIVRDYKGSIGVVTPFRGQANCIRRIIGTKPDLQKALSSRSFQVDTAHKFQGDERDVMIFSTVVSAGVTKGALHFLKQTGNVFNVAVTRARAGLVIVGDMQTARNSGVSHLVQLVQYVEELTNIAALNPQPKASILKFDSIWEEHFYRALEKEGIALLTQYNVEKYALDFALFDGDRRLNIEIDGERYHRDWSGDHVRRDLLRNSRLRELGWEVMRFWVYEVRDELDECIKRVKNWQFFGKA